MVSQMIKKTLIALSLLLIQQAHAAPVRDQHWSRLANQLFPALMDMGAVRPAAGPATSKDLVISSTATNAVQFRTLSTGTRLVRSTTAAYAAATLSSIRQAYNATAAASQVTTLDNVVVGDVIILRLRGLDQYAVVQVTGINRTSATDATVTFSVKAL